MNKHLLAVLVALGAIIPAHADVITDWNTKVSEFITEAKMGTPPAVRAMALVQTATYEAVRAAPPAGSIDAAVAAANRATLLKTIPAVQASIEAAYQAALAKIPDGPTKTAGIIVGEKAAAAVLAARADEMPTGPESYRPHTTPGMYVPTAGVAVPVWGQRKPWAMTSASQFRPGPPPALTSDEWTRNFNEVKAMGGRASTQRTAEQSDVAKFWEYSLPAIYCGVLSSVANQPGRTVTQNAYLYATATQAMDDALISVFDAKYQYNFWRPVTAIRNGDQDGNNATDRDAAWNTFVDTPMHPEYPSAHGSIAGAVGAVLKAEIGNGPTPMLVTSSPTLKGATRQWSSIDAFVKEVGDARVWAGLHYRVSTDVGAAMGKKIGEMAAKRDQPRLVTARCHFDCEQVVGYSAR
ncbi:PA-phosphatase [Betaproteobacteria bacterium GR16-43]|nr:PA-phosphatase [Betaproteobacteria bacterium GR16-43]